MKKDELPPGWAWAALGEIALVNPSTDLSEIADDTELSFVPMAAVEAETGKLDPSQTRQYSEIKKKSLTKFQEGDILFAKITPCMENGKIAVAAALVGGLGFGSTEFHVIRPMSGISTRYLLNYLLQKSVRTEAERNMTGAVGQRRVPTGYLRELRVPLPPIDEQERIVDALEDHLSRLDTAVAYIDSAVERTSRIIERVTDYSRVYTPLKSSECAPFLPSAGTTDGELPSIPADWEWCRLDEIAEVVGGVTKDRKKQSDPEYVEVPYLRVANVQRGRLDLDDIAMIRVAPKKAQQLELQPGDVLLNEGGDRDKLGRGWIWCGEIPRMIHQNHVFRARVRDSRIHPKLLSWHANSSARWFEENGKQSVNLASISLSKVKLLPVPVPPSELQDEMVSEIEGRLSMAEKAIEEAEKARARAQRLRRALLASAFAGKLVPQDPSEQPASYLVERIRTEQSAQPKPKRRRAAKSTTASNRPAPPSSATPAGTFVQEELGL